MIRLALLLGLATSATAQTPNVTVTISGTAVSQQGAAITASLDLSGSAAAIQFQVAIGTTVELSSESIASGKFLTCADDVAMRHCFIYGLSKDLLTSPAARLVFPGQVTLGPFILDATRIVVADDTPTADGATVAYQGLSVEITSPCDLDLSGGLPDLIDVQLTVAQALAAQAACNSGDINGDGSCNVIDVQLVANATQGAACPL